MTESMTERVENALFNEFIRRLRVENPKFSDSDWSGYARAAMEAMREPTGPMIAAFDRLCDDNGQCLVKTGYRAMIDAARQEEVSG